MRFNKQAQLLIGVIVSALTLIGIIYLVDFNEVWLNLKKLSLRTTIIILCVYVCGMIMRAHRWLLIMGLKTKVPFNLVFKGLVYGYMLNQLLPVKAGEIARVEYAHRQSLLGRSYLLGTIVTEKVFDVVVILVFLLISVGFSNTLMTRLNSQWTSVALIVLGVIILVLLMRNVHVIKKTTRFLPQKPRDYINRVLDNLGNSFDVFKHYKLLLKVLLLSFIIWLSTCFIFYLLLQNLSIEVPLYAYFFIVSAGTFGMIIPSTTANVGVYHAISMGSLMLFMVSKEEALSFAILAHAFDFFPNIIFGSIMFLFSHFKK